VKYVSWLAFAAAGAFALVYAQSSDSLDLQRVPAEQIRQRLVLTMASPGTEKGQDKVMEIAERSRRAGYNGLVLNDFKLSTLDAIDRGYQIRLIEFRKQFQELEMDLIPIVGAYGWSERILLNDPNLSEAMPVRKQELVVENGRAFPAGGRVNLLVNPGFEDADGPAALDWDLQDKPGEATSIAVGMARTGERSFQLQDMDRMGGGYHNGRIMQTVAVRPWTMYRAAMWVKTSRFASANAIRLFGFANGRVLAADELRVKRNQDWELYHVVFNSQDNTEMSLFLGVWGGGAGSAWIDDVELEEMAFVNLVRRDGAPLSVTLPDGTPLKEGRDFRPLVDPKMGRAGARGRYDRYHTPPLLEPTKKSGLKNGDRVLVSYYHAVTVHIGQSVACLDHPKVFKLFRREVEEVHELLQPRGYLLGHDEIRVANWCGSCNREGRSAGQLLAENVRRSIEIIREVDPDAEIYAWNDMFDPYHNALSEAYLVNGDFEGSWEGLPSETVILNWNIFRDHKRVPSFEFFAKRGHRQILAGYYDKPPKVGHRLTLGPAGGSSVSGAMYSTFRNRYQALEEFAEQAWGRDGALK